MVGEREGRREGQRGGGTEGRRDRGEEEEMEVGGGRKEREGRKGEREGISDRQMQQATSPFPQPGDKAKVPPW